ncbi:uncharacterized protein LOC132281741 [Cornus florida]|uniref:uncharacterized protein LOC132281741 n=1 Tax=Cornus florida TaxID=4283 RepID=UPI0028A04782|nr:uncharacterized protein LOC132281741 [Cornus florida]
MELYCSLFKKKDMASAQTLVCVKQVKQEVQDEWDETMPLPGDIIDGISDDADELFLPAKGKSELSSELRRISRQADSIWLKIRRGDRNLKLQVCVVADHSSRIQRKFTVRAASDDRHVAVLEDLTLEQCTKLQEMSRKVVNADLRGFNRKGVKYDWKTKVRTYLPDQGSTVVSSILFMPLPDEQGIEATTVRTMAWFSAAVSSGIPLVFVNIQTEQKFTSEKYKSTGEEISRCRQKNETTSLQIVQGIRLWFLPGIGEVLLELTPKPGDYRFGIDIKQAEEGFICVYSVTKGTSADRAGLGYLYEQASNMEYLVVISRLEGKNLMPSTVSSEGLIHCCDTNDIKETLTSAMDQMESIKLHIMSWPNQTPLHALQAIAAANLRPPN